jgi:hypothetical protein
MKSSNWSRYTLAIVILALASFMSANGQSADTLSPSENTYTFLNTPTIVMGADVLLRIRSLLPINSDQTLRRSTYLKFDLTSYTAAIDSAKLRLGAVQIVYYPGGTNRAKVYGMSDDGWTTATLTWNNAPPEGTYLFTQVFLPWTQAQQTTYGDTVYYLNITDFVKSEYAGDKIVSVCFIDDSLSGTDCRFRSTRATSGVLPALVIYRSTTNVQPEAEDVPAEFEVKQNYPNPFNPDTRISYSLPHAAWVKVTVYNVLGKEMKTIRDGVDEAGSRELRWDARSNDGRQVSSGVYFCRIHYGETTRTIKMILIR